MKTIYTLLLAMLITVAVKAQFYSVTSIPYAPPVAFTAGTPTLIAIDDIWSPLETLPFSFNFYGNSYTQLVIGSNGLISFDAAYPGTYCPWSLTTDTIPTPTYPLSSIMLAYQDIDPTYTGTIKKDIIGTAPNRKYIISYDSVPYFGGTGSVATGFCSTPPIFFTGQVVLYETTGIIDIYLQNKYLCSGWGGGKAIEGVQNATGTDATAVPGRNDTTWTASNDAWRFTPSGLILGIDSVTNADCGSNNGSITTTVSGGTSPYTYLWNSTPPQTGQNLTNVPAGNYCVTVTDFVGNSASTCATIDTSSYSSPSICMVSVDTASNHNIIIWEKPATPSGIDRYFIYKETSISGIYDTVGSQSYNVFSTFIDTSSNSLVQSNRYELAIYDSCGRTSALSSYHQTIHLSISAGMGGAWNLNWNDYIGFSFSTYDIYRGTNAGTLTLLASVASSVTSYTDLIPPAGTLYYLVEAVKPTPCNPSKSTQESPISNIASPFVSGITEASANDGIQIYPNPVTNNLQLQTKLQIKNIEITDITGRLLYTSISKTIDCSSLASGVYLVKITTEKGIAIKKFMKE